MTLLCEGDQNRSRIDGLLTLLTCFPLEHSSNLSSILHDLRGDQNAEVASDECKTTQSLDLR